MFWCLTRNVLFQRFRLGQRGNDNTQKLFRCCAMPHLLACVTIALRDRATAVQVLSVGCVRSFFTVVEVSVVSAHIVHVRRTELP